MAEAPGPKIQQKKAGQVEAKRQLDHQVRGDESKRQKKNGQTVGSSKMGAGSSRKGKGCLFRAWQPHPETDKHQDNVTATPTLFFAFSRDVRGVPFRRTRIALLLDGLRLDCGWALTAGSESHNQFEMCAFNWMQLVC